MTESQITKNMNYQRAKIILDRMDTPEYLFNLWRITGSTTNKNPEIEKVTPWYRGLESLIVRH